MAKIFSLSIFIFTFILLVFSFTTPAFAATDCGTACASPPSCPGDSGYNYQCSGSCPNSRYQRQYWQYNCWAEGTGWNAECGCYTGYSCACGPTSYGSWENAESCNPWQECSLTPVGGSHCVCQGSCLTAPTNPSPYSGEQDVKLPVTFSWYSVPGANSYRYKIDGVLEDYTINTQKTIDEAGACLLKSNTNYNWGVKACCTSDGTDGTKCGSWSGPWSFKTSLTPQPVSPQNNAINVALPVGLDWCDVTTANGESVLSYFFRLYKDGQRYAGPVLYPTIITKKDGALASETSLGLDFLTKNTTYEWEVASCLKENGLKCGKDCEDNDDGDKCGEFGQRWKFATGEITLLTPQLIAPKYNLGPPEETPITNSLDKLIWESIGGRGAFSYRYQIEKDGVVKTNLPAGFINEVSLSIFWDYLDFDTIYSWQVKSCWDEKGENCEGEWSTEWKFKTTGAKPSVLDADITIIPVKLNWENIPGAASYYYEVAIDSGFSNIVIPEPQRVVKNSEVLVDYPDLHQNTLYYWRVKTCADEKGEICGEWSNPQSFRTFRLEKPTNPAPADGSEFYTYEHYLGWGATLGAKFYQYKVDYGGAEKIPLTIVSTNSVFISAEQLELGGYSWYVRACLDKDCNETGDQAGPWHFILKEQLPPAGSSGVVPCGRYANVNDPYGIDEREPCQFKHVFLLLRNIIDFVLWRLGLIVLAILVMATGFVFYFSMGAPETMNKVKSILKSAGTGYSIVFLSWTLIDIILKILGYKVGLPWWHLQF